MDENEPTDGMDRRSLIKRAGIVTAGAAAWSTPMVTSLASRAYAGSPPTSCGESCGTCGNYQDHKCGSTGPFEACYCGETEAGGCACWENYLCDGSLQSCAQGQSCPSGTVCMTTCCGSPECVPLCGSNRNGFRRQTVGRQQLASGETA